MGAADWAAAVEIIAAGLADREVEACGVDHAFLTGEADVAVLTLYLRIRDSVVGIAFDYFLPLHLHPHRLCLYLRAFLLRAWTGLVEAPH